MKRVLALFLVLICMFSLVACDKATESVIDDEVSNMSEVDKNVSGETEQTQQAIVESISGTITRIDEDNIYDLVLNDVIMDAVAMNPTPTHNGQRLRIYYATQVSTQPPTFVVFVNDPELLHFSYKRYLENCMRQAFGFEGTPIHIIARNRD